jgi:hypothetical protein
MTARKAGWNFIPATQAISALGLQMLLVFRLAAVRVLSST